MVIIAYIIFLIIPWMVTPLISVIFLIPAALIIRKLPIEQNYKVFFIAMIGYGLGIFLLIFILSIFVKFVLNVNMQVGMLIAPAIFRLRNGIYRLQSRPHYSLELGYLIGGVVGYILTGLFLFLIWLFLI